MKKLAHELTSGDLAVFVGAGLSMASGGVSWSKLLADAAEELGLDIKREEKDLISVAQFYVNSKKNKGALVQSIYDQLNLRHALPNDNHKAIARMPISKYWTTNYDGLIERSLDDENRSYYAIYQSKQFLTPNRKTSARIFKMHGDITHPTDVVITREDFERYYSTHSSFISALAGDLVTNTFLFLGLSFTDPNLFYVLSRLLVDYDDSPRPHYAIMKRFSRDEFETEKDYEYALIRQNLMVDDLDRYSVNVLLVESHQETTKVLEDIERLFRKNTIFISGSANDYHTFDQKGISQILENVIGEQFSNSRKIVNGYGLGLGDMVIGAAVRKIYSSKSMSLDENLIVRPFPQESGRELWERYRQDMISRSGIAVFLLGNKLDEAGNNIEADGVYREFEISIQHGLDIVPVGATGYIARKIWNEVNQDFERFYPNASVDLVKAFNNLNREASPLEISQAINKFIGMIVERRSQ
ncbi:SIR2 family protein [Deinococcus antarcticus]|uniref:NAD(+) hydrolase ThsA n=1 Tax=Deinococcus antarcticus TaxID=1298767 RepID=A0ABV8AD41_9DEIO